MTTPPKPKKQVRYRTAAEIDGKIDRANQKIERLTLLAVTADERYRYLIQEGAVADAHIQKEKAELYWRQVAYQQEKRLPKLRSRMAAMQTELLPWTGNNDPSVAA